MQAEPPCWLGSACSSHLLHRCLPFGAFGPGKLHDYVAEQNRRHTQAAAIIDRLYTQALRNPDELKRLMEATF